MNWFEYNLIPNLPGPSLICMDNASYHQDREKTPTLKADVYAYLQCRGASVTTRTTLKVMKPMLKDYPRQCGAEERAKASGHEVLWLPPYHPDLNPIEKMWGVAKNYIRDTYNINEDTKDQFLKRIDEGFRKCTPEVWAKAVTKCENAAIAYVTPQWLDGIRPLTTPFVINLDDDDVEGDDDEVINISDVPDDEEVESSVENGVSPMAPSSSSSPTTPVCQVSQSSDTISMTAAVNGTTCVTA
jgi:hypothetical protein